MPKVNGQFIETDLVIKESEKSVAQAEEDKKEKDKSLKELLENKDKDSV